MSVTELQTASHVEGVRAIQPGQRSKVIAWTGMVVGVLLGLLMGLWSFDGPIAPPSFIGDYADPARRLLRLGHIACFGLGMLNLLLVRELASFEQTCGAGRWATGAMNFGNVFLPLVLVSAAVYQPLKYLLPIPAVSVLVALALMAYRVSISPYKKAHGG